LTSISRKVSARILIGILGGALAALGAWITLADTNFGYTLVGLGGGTLLTYLVVEVLLLREDRKNWKEVEGKVRDVIRSELMVFERM